MNFEIFRKRVELKAELSKLEAKEKELSQLLLKEYFAEFKIEGRMSQQHEDEDEIFISYRDIQVAALSQTCFSGATFGLWNALCKRFLLDLKELLEIQKLDVSSKLEEIG